MRRTMVSCSDHFDTFRHIQCLHLMYAEIGWVLLSSETQVQPQVYSIQTTFQTKQTFTQTFPFLSNNCRKVSNMRTGTEIAELDAKQRLTCGRVDERYHIPKGGTIFREYSRILRHCETTVIYFCPSPVQRLYQVKTCFAMSNV